MKKSQVTVYSCKACFNATFNKVLPGHNILK